MAAFAGGKIKGRPAPHSSAAANSKAAKRDSGTRVVAGSAFPTRVYVTEYLIRSHTSVAEWLHLEFIIRGRRRHSMAIAGRTPTAHNDYLEWLSPSGPKLT
jgi:hypothetical protein